ncbi:hypothetical protein QBC43DRAFT_335484 [Cladorrhinum sp. PSN259]|nr:hypothetical protein QBC43DRAFT_335484 [Cladorrhinum sp. PSN259]
MVLNSPAAFLRKVDSIPCDQAKGIDDRSDLALEVRIDKAEREIVLNVTYFVIILHDDIGVDLTKCLKVEISLDGWVTRDGGDGEGGAELGAVKYRPADLGAGDLAGLLGNFNLVVIIVVMFRDSDRRRGPEDRKTKNKAGYAKIQFCGDERYRLEFFCIDVCCIDNSDGVDLVIFRPNGFKIGEGLTG